MTSARLALSVSSILLALAGASVACSSSSDDTGTPPPGADGSTSDSAASDGATSDAAPHDASTDAGEDLYPADTTKVVVISKGGFTATAPAGSSCQQKDDTYTYIPRTHELSWKLCEPDDAGLYDYRIGQRTLPAAAYEPLEAAMHGLRRATDPACGADAPTQSITFSAPSGGATYFDDFYFCSKDDPTPYVKNLDDVIGPLSTLSAAK
ncbi:MAG: hypothetical protein JWP97_491 [Labilithrix sp.]|nr:hypothetical protein [Labilithrix sp.]